MVKPRKLQPGYQMARPINLTGNLLTSTKLEMYELKVDEIDKGSDLWQKIWELLTRSIVYLQTVNGAKSFESNSNSVTMNVNVASIESKR